MKNFIIQKNELIKRIVFKGKVCIIIYFRSIKKYNMNQLISWPNNNAILNIINKWLKIIVIIPIKLI